MICWHVSSSELSQQVEVEVNVRRTHCVCLVCELVPHVGGRLEEDILEEILENDNTIV